MMFFTLPVDEELALTLRSPGDAEEMFAVADASREHIAAWLPWPHDTHGPEQIRAHAERSLTAFADGKGIECAIRRCGRIVGAMGIHAIDRRDGAATVACGEIGYWRTREEVGRGTITRCAAAMLDYGFGSLGLKRIAIRAEPANEKSWGVAARLGMTREGTLRGIAEYDGRRIDHHVYAMLAEDWPAVRARLDARITNGLCPSPPGLVLTDRDGVMLVLGEPRHAQAAFEAIDANRVHLEARLPWPAKLKSVDDERKALEEHVRAFATGDMVPLTLWESGKVIGGVGGHLRPKWTNRWEIGWWLTESAQGRGLMTWAAGELMRYLFTVRQASSVFARALVDNPRSQAVAQRCGMSEFLRANVADHADGGESRAIHYGIERDDWSAGVVGASDVADGGTGVIQVRPPRAGRPT